MVPKLSVTLAALVLLLPGAGATWAVKGAWEPDTLHDVRSPWMRLSPELGSERLVYFNGFPASGSAVATTANPNLASAATSFAPTPFTAAAMLGIWRDCNRDGFVGLGDQGLLEYRAELLLDDSACPRADLPHDPWRSHNTGGWIIELVPIGYDDTRTAEDENAFNVNDTQARVWADWGLPGDPPRLSCPTAPAPYGTFRSTGGLLRHVDCLTGHRGVQLVNDATAAAGHPELGFGDAPKDRPDRSASPLNQPNPWGDADDEPMARAVDCSRRDEVVVSDPTDPGDGSGALHTIAAVPVPGGPTLYVNGTDERGRVLNATLAQPAPALTGEGSPAGTVNETQAATDCDREDADEMVVLDGERGGSDGDLPYALEGGGEPLAADKPRTRTDHVLTFEEGIRGAGVSSLALGSAAREDGGSGAYAVTGFWVGRAGNVVDGDPYVSRTSLGAEPVTYVTYYAWVGEGARDTYLLSLPAGRAYGIYGAEACARSPRTMDCEGEAWWRDARGADVTPRDARLGAVPEWSTIPADVEATKIGVKVGQPYVLRDIDCIDSSFSPAREGGLHWGMLTGTQCKRPT